MPGPSGMPNNVDSFGKLTICDCFWAETINQQWYLYKRAHVALVLKIANVVAFHQTRFPHIRTDNETSVLERVTFEWWFCIFFSLKTRPHCYGNCRVRFNDTWTKCKLRTFCFIIFRESKKKCAVTYFLHFFAFINYVRISCFQLYQNLKAQIDYIVSV